MATAACAAMASRISARQLRFKKIDTTVGTIDMAVWDAVAKIARKPLFRLLAIGKYEDRYVIPQAHTELASHLRPAIRQAAQGQHARRPGEQVAAGPGVGVDLFLDGEQEVRHALDLVENGHRIKRCHLRFEVMGLEPYRVTIRFARLCAACLSHICMRPAAERL